MSKLDPLRILVAGCGSIGRRHLQVLSERRDIELAAFDPLAEALLAVQQLVPGAARFATFDAALAWAPRLVVVAAPNHLHRVLCEESFAADAHVLCEKPIADTVEDGRAIVEAAARTGLILAMGYSERYRPSMQYVIEQARSGVLGNLVGGRAMVGTYNTLLCAKTDYRAHVYGALLVDYTHELDFLRAIFGDVAEIHCWANDLGERDRRCSPSVAVSTLRFASGALASVHMDYVQHPQRRVLEVFGDRGVLELDLQRDEVRFYDGADATHGAYRLLRFDNDRNNVIRAEQQDVIDAVLSGRPPRVSGAEGLAALELATRAIQQIAR